MQHLEKETLQNYAARQLSPAEMTAVILHLENCAACFRELQNLSSILENRDVAFLSEAENEVFHLDYDEHLRPFVDYEADAATREIVEGHTQNCASCAFQLRELREFSESLRLREIEKKSKNTPNFFAKVNVWIHQIPRRLTLRIVLPLLFLCVGIGVIFYLWKSSNQQPTQIAQSENISLIEPSIRTENPEISETAATPKSPSPTSPPKEAVAEKPEKIAPDDFPKEKKSAAGEVENLPAEVREIVRQTLASNKLFFPALQFSGINLKLRGEQNVNKKGVVYPNDEVVPVNKPTLRWENFGASDKKYLVQIFDEQQDLVAGSKILDTNYFQPETPLKNGASYSWEITSVSDEPDRNKESLSGQFQIIETEKLKTLNKIANVNPLQKGIVYAAFGLRSEAERYFRQALKSPPTARPARNFLRQLGRGQN